MPGNSFMGMFRPKTLDDHADDVRRELDEPPKRIVYGAPADPTKPIRDLGNYVSKSLGGPSLDPAFDALDMVGAVRTLGQRNPSMLGRPAKFSGKANAAAGVATNPLLQGLKTAVVGPPPQKPKPYQPTEHEAQLLRGMMRGIREPQRLATKATQPMQY